MTFRELRSELSRRSVWRVATFYIVAGVAALQGVDVLAQGLRLAPWVLTAASILVVLGLPVAMVLAWVFELTPSGIRRDPADIPADRVQIPPRLYRVAPLLVLSCAVMLATGWFGWRHIRIAAAVPMDDNAVLVLPFRVAADRDLSYLSDGMVDLLTASLAQGGGPRGIDPRTALGAWSDASRGGAAIEQPAALSLARQLGAGQLLTGGIVGSTRHVVITATIVGTLDGLVRASAEVEGPLDSLATLVDRLAIDLTLVNARAGETGDLPTTKPLPALRAYLAGMVAYRSGRMPEAVEAFDHALAIDSTFALAALYQAAAEGFRPSGDARRSAWRAWTLRDRLSERDRAHLRALLGPTFPAPSSPGSRIAAADSAMELAPQRPEVWFLLGDAYFHGGRSADVVDWRDRARSAMLRAAELDTRFVPPLQHLLDLAAAEEDTAAVLRIGRRILALDPEREVADYVRWHMTRVMPAAAGRDDPRRFDGFGLAALSWIVRFAETEVVALPDAELAARGMLRAARGGGDRETALMHLHHLAMNLGHRAEARAWLDRMTGGGDRHLPLRLRVVDALYWDGDTIGVEEAVRQLADGTSGDTVAVHRMMDLLLVDLWRIDRGREVRLPRAIAALRGLLREGDPHAVRTLGIAQVLLQTAHEDGMGRATERSHRRLEAEMLDSGVAPDELVSVLGNLLLARVAAEHGDGAGALRAIRRGGYMSRPESLLLASTLLRERGRLEAATGDGGSAAEEYRRYIRLRGTADPGLTPLVRETARELALLDRR